jgi:parallel beta-helix repeat protein
MNLKMIKNVVLFIFLLMNIPLVSAEIVPSYVGDLSIDKNTTWENMNLICQGDIVVINSSDQIDFTIKDSNIRLNGKILMGGTTPVNFTLINSTINFDVTEGISTLQPANSVLDSDQMIVVQSSSYKQAPSKIYLKDSVIQGSNSSYLAGGIEVNSLGTEYGQSESIVTVDNVTFRYLGGLSSTGKAYYALRLGTGVSSSSRITNAYLDECGRGLLLTENIGVSNLISNNGHLALTNGAYAYNMILNKTVEGIYNPADNSLIKGNWFDSDETKLNVMSASNVIFENNTVVSAAFNLGDGSYEYQGNNNTAVNNIFIDTGIISRKSNTKVISNFINGGMPSGGNIPIRVWGFNFTVDDNCITNGIIGTLIEPYYLYSSAGNHIISDNILTNNGIGISVNNEFNNQFINNTIEDTTTGAAIQLSNSEDQIFLDTRVYNSKTLDVYFKGGNDNIKFINTKFDENKIGFIDSVDRFNNYYYLDLVLIDTQGSPVSDASVDVQNVIVDVNENPINLNGEALSTLNVGSTGRTALPNDKLNSVALMDFFQTSTTKTEMEYALSISTNDASVNGITFDIDSSWYREDPNTPTYTITAIIPDSSIKEPQITGYAPSSDNPFTAGEKKKFQVWADQDLTTMKWYVNGNLRSSGSMDYTWEVESGTTTIMFSGSNSNGGVLQTWEITEGESGKEEPVSSGTGITFTPSATSLTATSGESTTFSVESGQEFTSAVWSLDGTEVESGATEHVQSWTTAGTHTVSFDGTADAGTISRTWTVVVSAAAESEYSSISISPSTTTVAPGDSFSLDVYIDPAQALTGSQFDLQYSQLASVFTVNEGDLFTAGDLSTTFQYDSIDNAAGLLDNVYAAIVGSGSITSPGAMATIEMVAGSNTGVMDIGLSDVILSDANSGPAGYTVSNATVLIDTAPQFVSVSSQTVEEQQSLSFTVSATDADGDELTYTATSIPSGATFNGGSLSWTPSEGDAGSYVASFKVTDGYLTDNVSVSITVTPMNHIPEISLFEPADGSTFEEGSTIDVNVAATDADGDSLSYILEIDGVQVNTSTSHSWITDYESAGTHTIKVTGSDGTDEVSSSATITITDLQPRWDVNEDNTVNVLDITLVGQNYGKTYTEDLPRWDVNQDGTVNIQDLSIVSGHFGEKL